MASISLNSTTFYPLNVEEQRQKVGTEITAANGAHRFAHRAEKREWTITWRRVTATVRNQVRAVHALTSTFPFVDQDGTSFTVLCLPNAMQTSVGLIAAPGGVVTLYYDVTLKIVEN